jgi:hypothetical protein
MADSLLPRFRRRIATTVLLTVTISILSFGLCCDAIGAIAVTHSTQATSAVTYENSLILFGHSDSNVDEHVAYTPSTGFNGWGIATGYADSVQTSGNGGRLVVAGNTTAFATTTDWFRGVEVISRAGGEAVAEVHISEPGILRLVYGISAIPLESINNPQVRVAAGPNGSSPFFSSSGSLGVESIPVTSDFFISANIGISSASSTINFSTDPHDPSQTPPDDLNGAVGSLHVWYGMNSLPGSTPDDPIIPARANQVLLADSVTLPVLQDYGIDQFIYLDPVYATGYSYHVDGSNFASFTVPNALPGGDEDFELLFGGMNFSLHSGDQFNFTDYVPLGISDFQLTGIAVSEQVDPDALPPFVAGFKFTTEGVATLTQTPILSDSTAATPEPGSMAIWGLGAVGCAILGFRRRKTH